MMHNDIYSYIKLVYYVFSLSKLSMPMYEQLSSILLHIAELYFTYVYIIIMTNAGDYVIIM